MTPALINPSFFVVFLVIHHPQDVDSTLGWWGAVEDPSDQSVTIVAHIKDDAVSDRVGRTKGLFERSEVGPNSFLGKLTPDGEISLGSLSVGCS